LQKELRRISSLWLLLTAAKGDKRLSHILAGCGEIPALTSHSRSVRHIEMQTVSVDVIAAIFSWSRHRIPTAGSLVVIALAAAASLAVFHAPAQAMPIRRSFQGFVADTLPLQVRPMARFGQSLHQRLELIELVLAGDECGLAGM